VSCTLHFNRLLLFPSIRAVTHSDSSSTILLPLSLSSTLFHSIAVRSCQHLQTRPHPLLLAPFFSATSFSFSSAPSCFHYSLYCNPLPPLHSSNHLSRSRDYSLLCSPLNLYQISSYFLATSHFSLPLLAAIAPLFL